MGASGRHQRGLELAVQTFDQAVGSWMVGASSTVVTTKQMAKITEDGGSELGTAICGDSSRGAKVRYLRGQESLGYCFGRCITNKNCSGPSRETVDTGQDMGVFVGRWQWTD